jgi:hypothetical protein
MCYSMDIAFHRGSPKSKIHNEKAYHAQVSFFRCVFYSYAMI